MSKTNEKPSAEEVEDALLTLRRAVDELYMSADMVRAKNMRLHYSDDPVKEAWRKAGKDQTFEAIDATAGAIGSARIKLEEYINATEDQ